MTTYRVIFERIGRTHNPPELVTPADGPSHLADLIIAHARPHLRSSGIDVAFDDDMTNGVILCGFRTSGSFAIAQGGEA